MARTRTTDDYGIASSTTSKLHRPLLFATHFVHWVSAIIVMSIAAYFISNYYHNTHLRYWVAVGAVTAALYIPLLALPLVKRYKGQAAFLPLILSYLWLCALVFTVQDYSYNGGWFWNSPRGVPHRGLKKTLEAFAFIAFFTSVLGAILEARLWDVNRARRTDPTIDDKDRAVPREHVTATTPHTVV
ncbi:hypothetical protein ACN47E_005506 [Coniothyrium glycines]